MRLFAGIPLAAEVIEELSAISLRLETSGDGLRWSAPESWHITLQFLGNTGQPPVPPLRFAPAGMTIHLRGERDAFIRV